MQRFIPFNDQWDDAAALVPYDADEARLAPVAARAVARCGSRFEGEDLFAGWPETPMPQRTAPGVPSIVSSSPSFSPSLPAVPALSSRT
jgi:hypothetical protein